MVDEITNETIDTVEITTDSKPVETVKTEEPTKSGLNFRYADPGCTGIAYYSETNDLEFHPVTNCKNCGVVLGAVEKDRFIPLTENEKQQLSAL